MDDWTEQLGNGSESSAARLRPAGPCCLVIFGATGDLTRRKLLPALYFLADRGLLQRAFAVIGIARTKLSQAAFRNNARAAIREFVSPRAAISPAWKDLEQRFFYVSGDFQKPATAAELKRLVSRCDREYQTEGNCLFYLATPPSAFAPIIRNLDRAGLSREGDRSPGWRRIIVEKPFGRDLESARELNGVLRKAFEERQIYRIDHYLGKETVQNLLVLRFANGIFEPIWNRRYVDHVQITVAETLGVDGRGRFYEEMGALRDVVQSHMLQLLALAAMEPPISLQPDAIHDERLRVLHAVRPLSPEDVLASTVRGQYGPGAVGQPVSGYPQESGVSPDSTTETYAALRLFIDNWRWMDVPFYLRTGKRLPKRITEIAVRFRDAPLPLFGRGPEPNWLLIRIQPEEGISLAFDVKVPGPGFVTRKVAMDFNYKEYFGPAPPTGYEILLYDAMIGDSTLFHRADMVGASWAIVTPILDVWKTLRPRDFPNYPAGLAWGPPDAGTLLKQDGREWHALE
ncbi:MAG TPA: glucose-6-phosphate dehydrogenase [Planctomycetota bacterium]|nr:glucose-6-phosphate dehydrogenase [Planctomycetota bacterium]